MTYVTAKCSSQSPLLLNQHKGHFLHSLQSKLRVFQQGGGGREEGRCMCLSDCFLCAEILDLCDHPSITFFCLISYKVNNFCPIQLQRHGYQKMLNKGASCRDFSGVSRFSSVQRYRLSFSKGRLLRYIFLHNSDHILLSGLLPTI